MLPGQMSLWQFESVLDVPRNLALKFHQNRISNSRDIAWVCVGGVVVECAKIMLGWGWVELWLSGEQAVFLPIPDYSVLHYELHFFFHDFLVYKVSHELDLGAKVSWV